MLEDVLTPYGTFENGKKYSASLLPECTLDWWISQGKAERITIELKKQKKSK